MSFFKRWKHSKSKAIDHNPVAQLNLKVFSDKMEFELKGDGMKVGGALVTVMLKNNYAHSIINNAVVATNREIAKREYLALTTLTTFNLN